MFTINRLSKENNNKLEDENEYNHCFVVDLNNLTYLHDNGEVRDSAMAKYSKAWYKTERQAQKAIDKYYGIEEEYSKLVWSVFTIGAVIIILAIKELF